MAGIAITDPGAGARIKGPVYTFFKVDVPASGSNMTLTATAANDFKTPDATENADAVFAGCFMDLKTGVTQESGVERCDGQPAPIAVLPGFSDGTFELTLKSFVTEALLELLVGATANTISATTQFEFGSHGDAFPEMAIAFVGRMPNDPTKYWYHMLYRVFITSLFGLDALKLNQYATLKVTGRVAGYPGRVPGKEYGQHVINL